MFSLHSCGFNLTLREVIVLHLLHAENSQNFRKKTDLHSHPIHTCFPMIATNVSEMRFASHDIYYVILTIT